MTNTAGQGSVPVRFEGGSFDDDIAYELPLIEGLNDTPGKDYPPSRVGSSSEMYRRTVKSGDVWVYKLMHKDPAAPTEV